MSTFNDNIRRELGFGLISWNAPEHRAALIPSPQSGKPARENGSTHISSSAAMHGAQVSVPGGR